MSEPTDVPKPRPSYPFRYMEIGESFFTADYNVRAAATAAGKRLGRTFAVGKQEDGQFKIRRIK